MGGGFRKNETVFVPDHTVWVCPVCDGNIRWSCGYTGRGYAYCENSPSATRMFKPGDSRRIDTCDWEGLCERRPDGKVEIYYYGPI